MATSRAFFCNILVLISCAAISNCASRKSEKSDGANTTVDLWQEERLDISYNNDVLKEIEADTLQLVGNASNVFLQCKSTTRKPTFVNWQYHGEEDVVVLEHHQNFVWIKNFGEGPPVARVECMDRDNASISNSTLIYRGDGKPPYLYKSGKSLSATVLNKTTARLPCLLNYPLEALDHLELQLFKDGVKIANKDNCFSYTPEHGYTLNLTKLEQSFGSYECRVINLARSSNHTEDYVKMELTNDDLIRSEIEVKHQTDSKSFFRGEPFDRIFNCKIPKSRFEKKFEWFYLLSNGNYTPLHTTISKDDPTPTPTPDPLHYVDTVRLQFPSTDITHVVCLAYTLKNEKSYNNTYPVEIREPKLPKIINPASSNPVFYTDGMNLTCLGEGDPIAFQWLKNGKGVEGLDVFNSFIKSTPRSTIILKPFKDDIDSNYTCVAENFMGNATTTYRVQTKLDAKPDSGMGPLVTLGICLAAFVVLLLLLFTFFQVRVKRRKFGEEKIRRFFHGFGARNVQFCELEDESQEPFESVSYDTTKEININSLNFVRELKGGNFGKVQFGYYRDKSIGYCVPVAIKSIKDDPTASQEDVEVAFDNFLKEIKIVQILGEHPNVVRYIGAVTSELSRYSAYLVVEYCSEGDLCTYLRTLKKMGGSFYDDIQGLHNDLLTSNCSVSNNRGKYSASYCQTGSCEVSIGSMNGVVLKTSHLMKWAEDIASGMEYIASKHLVHRDIAARNVLLAYEGRDCNHPDPGLLRAKVSDFGLSKDLQEFPSDYYPILNRNCKLSLPLRWMSVETLQTLKFSTQSDVWAFGVTLWEMFTLGKSPYRDLVDSDILIHALLNYLNQGKLLPEPELAPQEIWEIMSCCWSENPIDRPSFKALRELLHAINENVENQVNQEDPIKENTEVLATNTGYSTVNFIENLEYEEEEGDSQSVQSGNEEDESENEERFV